MQTKLVEACLASPPFIDRDGSWTCKWGVFMLGARESVRFETSPCKKQSRWTDQAMFQGTPLVPLDLYHIEIPQIS